MIKLEHAEVVGWEAAIRGMRNPMNSWEKSDSIFSKHVCSNTVCWTDISLNELPPCNIPEEVHVDNWTGLFYNIGTNDHELMMKLRNAGTDHRKFMRMIVVYVDVTAPLYWWKEFKTYRAGRRFGDDEPDIIDDGYLECDIETNSCSTMHKIHEKEFTLEDFSCEHLMNSYLGEDADVNMQVDGQGEWTPKNVLEFTIDALNHYRNKFLETKIKPLKDEYKRAGLMKKYWWQMIQLLPSSYNQKRTIMLSYEVLANIYKSRKNHKLDEWFEFCKWIEDLPYSELITGPSLNDIPICNEIVEEAKRRVTNEED